MDALLGVRHHSLSRYLSVPRALQDLVEVVMSVKSAVERQFGQEIAIGGVGGGQNRLASKLSEYANLLAAQGKLVNFD